MDALILAGLRSLPPEFAHQLTLKLLMTRAKLYPPVKNNNGSKRLMGLNFTNSCGIAAGLDKNGDCIQGLQSLGVGFIELGTVTPQPQRGNPPPRIWRIPSTQAVVNRLGFNNKGVEHLARQLHHAPRDCILGANIGKGASTSMEKAHQDYLFCFERLHSYADYLCINISSPNTTGLRRLQKSSVLAPLLTRLKEKQASLHRQTWKYTPLVVKIAPDLADKEIKDIAKIVSDLEIDGITATNTTTEHSYQHQGGLSGKPLRTLAMRTLQQLRSNLNKEVCLISVGGISSQEDMRERVAAGADLIQVYTALVYQGVSLLNQLIHYEATGA